MTRAVRASAALILTIVLTGCTAPLPPVSFYGNRVLVTADPALWCATDQQQTGVDCRVDTGDAQAPRLAVGPGQAVSINVPALVSDAPWVVLFQVKDAAGTIQELRSPLFAAREANQYVLHPPNAQDQLVRIEVQAGLTPVATDTGTGVDYAALRTWVLLVDPTV